MTERSNGGSVTNLPLGRSKSASRSLSARQFQSLRSELLDRLQFATEHGISFSGARDLYAAGGYPRKLTNRHYLELYERGDIAERLVEAYPKATWSPGTSIFEDEDPEHVTDWEISINDGLFNRLDVWNVFKRADNLSRIGEHGYSVILIGDNTRTPFDQEMSSSVSFESIIYLQPLHEKNARILDFDEDLYSERFGLPLYYQLNLGKGKSQSQRQPKVHWSRVIHFTEGGLDNNVYGPPALRSIYNRLMDMEKIYTAGSEAAFKRMDPGAAFSAKDTASLGDTDPEIDLAIDEMKGQLDDFYHGLKRYLLLNNMDVTPMNAPVHNFGANIDSIIKVIAGAKEFPQRKLVGSEEAQLASEQDRSSWQDSIAQRRLNVAEPHVRAFVERVGSNNPEEWDIFWPDKGELNLHEKAELVERLARANYYQFQADGTLVLTSDEIRDAIDYEALDQEPNDEPIDQDRNDVDPDAPIMSDNRSRANRSLKSSRYAALLTTKRKHIERKLKSRGVVLVNPHDVRNRNLAHTDRTLAHADDRDEQTAVRRIADNARSGFAAMMADLWASIFNDDTVDVLRLSLDNLERAESFAMSLIDEMETRARLLIKDRLTSVMERTAKASLRVVERRGSFSARRRVGRFESTSASTGSMNEKAVRGLKLMDFNIANPRAIEWARTRSSALITEIGSSTREAVKSMIAEGIKEGRAPRLIAKEIRERVGLRSDQLETLRSFAATGATEKQIERRAKQLLKQRSELIARTETLRSSNQGLREMWYQARDNDLLPADVKREWIATADDRTRDEHADLDGEQVGLDEPFSLGFEPGEEPACRCSQGIV